jgi:hypothetical protein
MAPERKICITAADGQTGRLTAELLLSEPFSSKFASLTLLALNPDKCEELKELGGEKVNVVEWKIGDKKNLLQDLKDAQCDTMFLIPPAHEKKFEAIQELIERAGELKTVQNVVLLSAAGCDVAEQDKQPSIRQFINLEALVMKTKGDTSTGGTGHSPCIIRYVSFLQSSFTQGRVLCGESLVVFTASQIRRASIAYRQNGKIRTCGFGRHLPAGRPHLNR